MMPPQVPFAPWTALANGASAEGVAFSHGLPVMTPTFPDSSSSLTPDLYLASVARFVSRCPPAIQQYAMRRVVHSIPVEGVPLPPEPPPPEPLAPPLPGAPHASTPRGVNPPPPPILPGVSRPAGGAQVLSSSTLPQGPNPSAQGSTDCQKIIAGLVANGNTAALTSVLKGMGDQPQNKAAVADALAQLLQRQAGSGQAGVSQQQQALNLLRLQQQQQQRPSLMQQWPQQKQQPTMTQQNTFVQQLQQQRQQQQQQQQRPQLLQGSGGVAQSSMQHSAAQMLPVGTASLASSRPPQMLPAAAAPQMLPAAILSAPPTQSQTSLAFVSVSEAPPDLPPASP